MWPPGLAPSLTVGSDVGPPACRASVSCHVGTLMLTSNSCGAVGERGPSTQ